MVQHKDILEGEKHTPKAHTHDTLYLKRSADDYDDGTIVEKGTPIDADRVLIEDSAASFVKKWVELGNLPGGGGGSSTWLGLTDTPGSFGALQLVRANSTPNALEFVNPNTLDVDKVDGCDAGVATTNVFKIPASLARGDIFYVNTSGNLVRLPAGTNGHFLKTQSTSGDPVWEALPGGGDMLKSTYDPNADGIFAIAQGGTGQSTAQAAIDALSQVAGATNEHVLTKDTGTGNATWKVGGSGGGDMLKSVYDSDDDGVIAVAQTEATKYPDTGEQAFLDADHTKLNGIATGADVTGSNPPQAHNQSAATITSGILAVARGGTGVTGDTYDARYVNGCDTGLGLGQVFKIDSYDTGSLYYSKSSLGIWILTPSTDGYLLTTHGAGNAPTWEAPGSGGGDMLKSTYDPDDDGILAVAQGGTGVADDTYDADKVDGKHATDFLLLDGTQAMAASLDMNAERISNVFDPSNAQDAATKFYVDAHNWAATDITSGTLPVSRGGTGQSTEQAAIDALSAVSGATNEHVLTKDTGTGNAKWKAAGGGAGDMLKSTYDANDDGVIAVAQTEANNYSHPSARQCTTGNWAWASITGKPSTFAPSAHENTHESGGSDVIEFDSLADGSTYKKFLATERTKLTGIETGATKYPDTGEQAFLDADHTKLNGIETGADVTDATNVTAAGAVMRTSQNITLASNGTITPDGSLFLCLDTYGGAATDNLDHVYLTNYQIGDVITFTSQNITHDVTIQDYATGGGMIYLEGDVNFTLAGGLHVLRMVVIEYLTLKRLIEISRFDG